MSGQLSARILKEAAAQREEVDADDAGLGPAAGRQTVRAHQQKAWRAGAT